MADLYDLRAAVARLQRKHKDLEAMTSDHFFAALKREMERVRKEG